jgi:hypothetical protein
MSVMRELDDAAEYRPVSRLAVAAVAAGVASALAVISPVFLAVPLVGLAVAAAAFRDLGSTGATKAGRLAALAGLALSVGFGAQGLAEFGVSRWLAGRRAEAAARYWLEAICEGRSNDARSMGGPDAEAAVARLAECCGGNAVTARRTGGGETPGAVIVQAAVGECTARITLAAETTTAGGGTLERWTIVACDVSAAARAP